MSQLFIKLIKTQRILKSLTQKGPISNPWRCFTSSPLDNLLDTTKVKILRCYDGSVDYIESLIEEKRRLHDLTSNEAELNKLADKQEVFQKLSQLESIEDTYKVIVKATNDSNELSEMLGISEDGDEFAKALTDDLLRLEREALEMKTQMIRQLIPDESEDKENALVELSAGVGGLESGLFCAELYAMYEMYAGFMGWTFSPTKVDTDTVSYSEVMRKAVFEIEGEDAYKHLKFESGVHRVQRVPKTDSKGRIHTSTVGVVVSPKPKQINIKIDPKDLKIETKTSGGPGGQHANKTESAVRLTHLPTGIVIYSDGERHMMQNRQQAMDNLLHKLYQQAFEEQLNKRQLNRKMQIGSSSRSSRIRTYNFIQDRITDHRLGENFVGIGRFLAGENSLHKMIQNLMMEQETEVLYEVLDNEKEKTRKI